MSGMADSLDVAFQKALKIIAAKDARIAELEFTLKTVDDSIKEAHDDANTIQSKLSASEARREHLVQIMKEQEGVVASLQKHFEDANEKVLRSVSRADYEALREKLSASEGRVRGLESIVAVFQETESKLRKQMMGDSQ